MLSGLFRGYLARLYYSRVCKYESLERARRKRESVERRSIADREFRERRVHRRVRIFPLFPGREHISASPVRAHEVNYGDVVTLELADTAPPLEFINVCFEKFYSI